MKEAEIQKKFLEKGWSLAVAESCTGGRIAARLTKIPGASAYFLGSLVVYSNELKERVLQVPRETLENYGAVSPETIEAMLSGTWRLTKSDFAIAISGIAGPAGGTPQKPVGTIWCGLAKKNEPVKIISLYLKGTRDEIMEQATDFILDELLKFSS